MFSSACVWLLFVSIHNLFMQSFCIWYQYFGEGLNVSESVIIYFFLNKFVSILIWVTVWFLDICLTYNWLHIPIICWITFWLTVRQLKIKRVRVRVCNTTSNNISVISWWSVLLVEETMDMSQVTDKLYHIMLYRVHLAMSRIQFHKW